MHRALAAFWIAFVVMGACKKSATTRPPAAEDSRRAAPSPADASLADVAPDAAVTPATRALWQALLAMDSNATRAWLDARDQPHPEGYEPPPPPPSLQLAIDALVAWDRDPSPLEVPCNDTGTGKAQLALLYVCRAALALATMPPHRELHAVLHLGEALRRSQTGTLLIGVGVAVAVEAAKWGDAHGVRSELFALYDLADTVPRDSARADARCIIEALERTHDLAELHVSPEEYARGRRELGMADVGSLEDELPTVLAFWRETKAQIDRVKDRAELERVLDARQRQAASHPSSVLVRTLGRPASRPAQLGEQLDEYRRLVARLAAP
jgi:hypothetical protein